MSLVEMAVDPEARLVATPVVEPVVEPGGGDSGGGDAGGGPGGPGGARWSWRSWWCWRPRWSRRCPEGPVVRAVRSERAGHRNQEATVASTPLPNVRKH